MRNLREFDDSNYLTGSCAAGASGLLIRMPQRSKHVWRSYHPFLNHKSSEAQPRSIGLDLHTEEIQLHITLADGSSLKPNRFVTSRNNIQQLC
jgi:hypothetical protein